jgi:hypothetical protein
MRLTVGGFVRPVVDTGTGGRTSAQEQNAYQQVLDTGRLNAKQPIDLKKIFATELLDKANGK